MNAVDIELLLKDLSARLPYGVKLWSKTRETAVELARIDIQNLEVTFYFCKLPAITMLDRSKIERFEKQIVKPYLRLLSDMTEEEREELKQEQMKDNKLFAECLKKAVNGDDSMRGMVIPHFAEDWCIKNHFDYRGLIERDLAIAVTENNNPYK